MTKFIKMQRFGAPTKTFGWGDGKTRGPVLNLAKPKTKGIYMHNNSNTTVLRKHEYVIRERSRRFCKCLMACL